MFTFVHKLTYSISLAVGILSMAYSQGAQYEIDFNQTEGFTVTGTSTLSDWTVKVEKIGGQPAVLTGLDDPETTIENFYFFASANEMEGGRGSSMNDKIKLALKSTEFPLVEYRQTEPAIISSNAADQTIRITSSGSLTAAGVSKPIKLQLSAQKEESGDLILQGQQELKFSEFDIEPPSAMFGQIVCGDEIQINIILRLRPTTQN